MEHIVLHSEILSPNKVRTQYRPGVCPTVASQGSACFWRLYGNVSVNKRTLCPGICEGPWRPLQSWLPSQEGHSMGGPLVLATDPRVGGRHPGRWDWGQNDPSGSARGLGGQEAWDEGQGGAEEPAGRGPDVTGRLRAWPARSHKRGRKVSGGSARHGGRSRGPAAAAQLRPGDTARTPRRTPATASTAAAANETPPAPRWVPSGVAEGRALPGRALFPGGTRVPSAFGQGSKKNPAGRQHFSGCFSTWPFNSGIRYSGPRDSVTFSFLYTKSAQSPKSPLTFFFYLISTQEIWEIQPGNACGRLPGVLRGLPAQTKGSLKIPFGWCCAEGS